MNLTPLQVEIKKQMGLITDHDVEWRFHWKFWQPVYIYARKHRFGRYCVVRERSYLSTQSTVGRMVVERGLAEDVHTATPMNGDENLKTEIVRDSDEKCRAEFEAKYKKEEGN